MFPEGERSWRSRRTIIPRTEARSWSAWKMRMLTTNAPNRMARRSRVRRRTIRMASGNIPHRTSVDIRGRSRSRSRMSIHALGAASRNNSPSGIIQANTVIQPLNERRSIMLSAKEAMATVAVKDLNVGKKFYGETLGLKEVAKQGEEAITYKSGNSKLLVYRSQFAGTNKATATNWIVGNEIENIVQTLRSKGVKFEHYDLPGLKRNGDLYTAGDFKTVWLKDPDGNILSLVTG